MTRVSFLIVFLAFSLCEICTANTHSDMLILPRYRIRQQDDQAYPVEDNFRVYSHRDNTIEDVYLRFYNGATTKQYVDIKLQRSTELLQQPDFRKQNPTVLYIHGYQETAESESVLTVVSSYLENRREYNVILLDWSNMAFGSYFINSAPNTKKVAHAVAVEIKKLVDQGLPLEKLHIVGHSLGGQISGFIGKELQAMSLLLERISGLDPAFPEFYPGLLFGHISSTDARFVDIIHTDAGGYGAPVHTGTADFWPNGGKAKQPGCPKFTPIPLSDEDLCSHWRSWRFWAESVKTPQAFPAVANTSYRKFKKENTSANTGSSTVYMGFQADSSAIGDFYLTTNAASPFGKGTEGTYYQKK